MEPSRSFAEAHSFAKNANEWGTRQEVTPRLRDRVEKLLFIIGSVIVGALLAQYGSRDRLSNSSWLETANKQHAESLGVYGATKNITIVDFPEPEQKSIIGVQLWNNVAPSYASPFSIW